VSKSRYEHKKPGDLGHIDLKLLPPILGEKVVKGQKEYLLTLVDDCTRIAYFTVIAGKNQHQTKVGLQRILARCSISFSAILSDNGKEFKGLKHQHQVELLLEEKGIKHRYTKVRRPQTNGKVERLNRTVSEEFLTKVSFENRLHREAELRLYEYYYNRERQHQGINNLTPHQKLTKLSPLKFM
jgi:transposase InsO family protein